MHRLTELPAFCKYPMGQHVRGTATCGGVGMSVCLSVCVRERERERVRERESMSRNIWFALRHEVMLYTFG